MRFFAILFLMVVCFSSVMSKEKEFIRLETVPQSMATIDSLERGNKFTEVSVRYMKEHLFQIQNETGSQGGAYCFVFGIVRVGKLEFILYCFGSDHESRYYLAQWNDTPGYPATLQIGEISGNVLYSDFIILHDNSIIINTVKKDSEYNHIFQEIYRLDKHFTRLSKSYHNEECEDYWGRNNDDDLVM